MLWFCGGNDAGIMNAMVIATGNECAILWSKMLATRENHRTQKDYEAHYNLYVFLFRFLVSYASFFYIAFLKQRIETEGCVKNADGVPDCMQELAVQIGTIFLAFFIGQNAYESMKPLIFSRLYKMMAFTSETELKKG